MTPNSDAQPKTIRSQSSRRTVILSVAAMGAAAGLGWHALTGRGNDRAQAPRQPLPESVPLAGFWSQTLASVEGLPMPMAQFRGRPLIVNFWATWCAPCVEELPLLNRFYQQNSSKGIQLLGIAVDKGENVKPFLGRIPLQFPVALAGFAGIQASKDLGNLGGGLPFTVVWNKAGEIIQRRMGIVQNQDLQAWAGLA
jgi:thiol-disulfide isomerase/thioredoxin